MMFAPANEAEGISNRSPVTCFCNETPPVGKPERIENANDEKHSSNDEKDSRNNEKNPVELTCEHGLSGPGWIIPARIRFSYGILVHNCLLTGPVRRSALKCVITSCRVSMAISSLNHELKVRLVHSSCGSMRMGRTVTRRNFFLLFLLVKKLVACDGALYCLVSHCLGKNAGKIYHQGYCYEDKYSSQ